MDKSKNESQNARNGRQINEVELKSKDDINALSSNQLPTKTQLNKEVHIIFSLINTKLLIFFAYFLFL